MCFWAVVSLALGHLGGTYSVGQGKLSPYVCVCGVAFIEQQQQADPTDDALSACLSAFSSSLVNTRLTI